MRRKYDQLWKGLLEEVFDDLLRFFFPEADTVIDMRKGFEFLDKELSEITPVPENNRHARVVDKLVKVRRLDGPEEWILVHIEIQGKTKKPAQFPLRMFRYYYRIFDRYQRPMTALAIYTARDGPKIPDRYEHHFLGTSHIYRYNNYCITTPTDEELQRSDNPFALVVLVARKALLAGKIPEKELLQQKLLVAKALIAKKRFSKRKIRVILNFLVNYIQFEKEETNRIFTKQFNQLTRKTNTMGIAEQIAQINDELWNGGLAKGLARGRREGLAKGKAEAVRLKTETAQLKTETAQLKAETAQFKAKAEAKAEAKTQALKAEFEKKQTLFVKNLLKGTDFSMTKIASLAGVSTHFVKKVKTTLSSK